MKCVFFLLFTIVLFCTTNCFAFNDSSGVIKCIKLQNLNPDKNIQDHIKQGISIVENIQAQECRKFNKIKNQIPSVSHDALKQALQYRIKFQSKFKKNDRYISFADYSMNSSQKRFYLINLYSGEVISEKVSHGRNSDNGRHIGIMSRCKKRGKRTNATRPGFFKIQSPYVSRGSCKLKKKNGEPTTYSKKIKAYGRPKNKLCAHGEFRNKKKKLISGWPELGPGFARGQNALRMEGLSQGVNHLSRSNGVVMHGAAYNQGNIMGRSYGCPAFHPDVFAKIAIKIQKGSLYYSYTPQCIDDLEKVLTVIPNWDSVCL